MWACAECGLAGVLASAGWDVRVGGASWLRLAAPIRVRRSATVLYQATRCDA